MRKTFILLIAAAIMSAFGFVATIHAQVVPEYWDFDPAAVKGHSEGPARNDIVPGEFLMDPPTLENLGFRWYIEGDSNRNATVEVAYRKKGEAAWREALPMHRVHYEIVQRYRHRDKPNHYRVGNLFAGSVLFLQPGTEHEVRLTMRDPDGGAPPEPKIVSVATRAEPPTFAGERVLNVYPKDHRDVKAEPAFADISSALDAARAGDVVFLHPGVHAAIGAPYFLSKSGEAARPIVVRGAGADKSVLEAADLKTDLFRIPGAEHIIFEDLAMRQARTAITTTPRSGEDRSGPGAAWITVRRCRMENVINGIWTISERSHNWIITDNEIIGGNVLWYPRTEPGRGYMDGSHTGVNVYGQGIVVCYNRITRFSDSLAIANNTHPPADDPQRQAVNIDFYNNDLSFATDDTLEADYGCHNIRVYRNLCYNAHTGLSVQPSYGGPLYFVRNEVYGMTYLSFKWNNQSTGMHAYHNTTVSGGPGFNTPLWSNSHLRNNLILGPGSKISSGTFTPERTTLDYNGWGGGIIRWTHGRAGRKDYATLAEFSAATGYEKNGIEVDLDVFVNAPPVTRGKTYSPSDFDLRLKPGSKAVDAGARLPNINDDFAGNAPDLGAIELGQPRPHYGPRK